MNCHIDKVCQWLLHLRATRGEAASYISEVVPITGEHKPVADYTPDEVAAIAEAYRRINKWDALMTKDIEEQENAPRSVDGWNEETLSVDS